MDNSNSNEKSHQLKETNMYFEQYWKHADALRNWFVVYGIGGIALLLTESAYMDKLKNETRHNVIMVFFIAVFMQVLLACINKWIHWYIYTCDQFDNNEDTTKESKVSFSLIVAINMIADLISLLSFLCATWMFLSGLKTC